MASSSNDGNAHNEILDPISTQIDDELKGLSPTPPEKSIFKVHNQLRKVNEEAYKPQHVAIGPYHCNSDSHLHHMETVKKHHLQQMLSRRGETTVDRYVQALRKIEDEVRQQYAGIVTLAQEKFIEMMLLDGCFIIEYFRKCKMARRDENDPLVSVEWNRFFIYRDLVLLENQVPFVVITTLYDLTNDDEQQNLIDLALNFFVGNYGGNVGLSQEINCCKHLIDLVYQGYISGISQEAPPDLATSEIIELHHIYSATELKEFGIKFKLVQNRHMFDIKFNKGTLEIPTITIADQDEPLLRNLIAYEQHCPGRKIKYVTDYVSFLDLLVNTSKDVELLRRKGIIANYLGDDEVVSDMLNKMGAYIPESDPPYYASIYNEVNKHCKNRWNRWIASLQRDYFHSPWAFISIFAAIMLLVLTLTQTVYTVTSYYHKKG